MNLYDHVSLFIDESGDLAHPKNERLGLLVGGLLVFGEYHTEADSDLRATLERAVQSAGGTFPADLHASSFKSTVPPTRPHQMREALAHAVRRWGALVGEAFAVALTHRSDSYTGGASFFAEREADNRYVRMLVALIEHLLFVNPSVVTRLAPNAKVNLYVASRKYVLCEDIRTLATREQRRAIETQRARLQAQGYEVKDSQGKVYVPQSLQRREIAAYVRSACWLQWPKSRLRLARVSVESINYDGPTKQRSAAGLYVADLLLGELRRQLATPTATKLRRPMLPPLVCLPYGPWLGQAAQLKAALDNVDAHTYLAVRTSMTVEAETASVQGLVNELDVCAGTSLGLSQEQARQLLSEACIDVDQPGEAARGLRKVELAERMLPPGSTAELRAMMTQARLSAANHTGNRASADAAWETFVTLEPELPRHGSNGLRLAAEIRNRRAVALTDQFRYDDAAQILNAVVSSQESVTASIATAFRLRGSHLPNRELAACLGSLGQIHALRRRDGDDSKAESYFRRAITLFTDRSDIERQWIYLGHLACDRGVAGRSLWDEVLHRVPALQEHRVPISQAGKQFMLALQAKGVLVFGDTAEVSAFLAAWTKQSTLRVYSETTRSQHPFGLIYQAIGMMYARVFREAHHAPSQALAANWFAAATTTMSDGGPLLKVLSCIAQMRRLLLVPQDHSSARQDLARALAVMRGVLIEGIGDAAWMEGDDGRSSGAIGNCDPGPAEDISVRCASIMKAFAFNYW